MKNLDIRNCLKQNHIFHYELANALNISEMTLVKKLRKELSKLEKEHIFSVIEELKNK